MNRYIVIRRSTIEELEMAVNSYVSQKGYQPQGGISSQRTNGDGFGKPEILWSQALWLATINI